MIIARFNQLTSSKLRQLSTLLIIAFCQNAEAAGFDCNKAASPAEKIICANTDLSYMDDDLSWLYAHLKPESRAKHKLAQLKWLRERNLCVDSECLQNKYIDRIQTITKSGDLQIPNRSNEPSGDPYFPLKSGWIPERGGFGTDAAELHSDFCVAARNYMNSYAADWTLRGNSYLENRCITASLKIPGLKAPPWQDLNPKEQVSLLSKLLRLRAENVTDYFDPQGSRTRRPDKYYRDEANRFIADGGTLQIWTSSIFHVLTDTRTGEVIPARGKVQTVVQLRWPDSDPAQRTDSNTCRPAGWSYNTFLVLQDLSGPSPLYSPGLMDSTLMLHEGVPIMLTNYATQLSISDTRDMDNSHSCVFDPVVR